MYKRGSSFETTIPKPMLFALQEGRKYHVVFSYDTIANKWYVKFEANQKPSVEEKLR
ncbi:MAG: hypothetical protein KJ601_05385 [Nanoarchaeota archaeon]|nr:hypothetical protein [Nanoarchaeota archaeon]MBU1704649.1 hypothetical protein [Nanoarchaeota archaeon]